MNTPSPLWETRLRKDKKALVRKMEQAELLILKKIIPVYRKKLYFRIEKSHLEERSLRQ
jgi:hypothetical protein